jgi:hypothetical protein
MSSVSSLALTRDGASGVTIFGGLPMEILLDWRSRSWFDANAALERATPETGAQERAHYIRRQRSQVGLTAERRRTRPW